MKKNIKNKAGFTLIEIIVSIALFGIIAIALLSSAKHASTILFSSGQFMEKNYILQNDLENFISGDIFNDKYDTISEDFTFNITWSTPIAADFSVNGIIMHMSSDALAQDEIFYVFYSQEISISNPK